ncbi:MAG: peroxiredoxin [Opitutales bacterium]
MRIATFLSLSILLPMFGFGKDPLAVGAEAPTLSVTTHTGETLDLGSSYAEGPVLVYFYPKAFTPGCTAQACNLRDEFADLAAEGITVLGVSRDSVEKQAEFRAEYNLPFTLIADTGNELGKAFGVGSMMGVVHKRQSFLVVDGKVAWRDLSATPASQAQDLLAAYAALRAS